MFLRDVKYRNALTFLVILGILNDGI